MVELKFLSLFTTFFLFLSPSSVLSRTLLQQRDISSFSLKLYPRNALYKSQFKSLKEISLDRLERDVARVNFLKKKIYRAIHGNGTSDLKTMDLEIPITSGKSQGSGEYFARFGYGTPPKQLYTAIDTGSDITWIQCTPCDPLNPCYPQTDPLFDPSMSSSYKPLACDSQQCSQLDRSRCYTSTNTCAYRVDYGDNSFTEGDFVTETVTFGDSTTRNIAIGCGRKNQGLFMGSAGLLGLGGNSLSFPSQINSPSFSYCLVDKDATSASTLEFGSLAIPSDAITVPLLVNSKMNTFYYVGLTGISVGGQMLPISPSAFALDQSGDGGVIVDSGTAVTRFQPEVYNMLRDEFIKGIQGLPPPRGFLLFDTCYELTSRPPGIPRVAFLFDTKTLELPDNNYFTEVAQNVFCLSFATISQRTSIIGNTQQQGMRVSFDVGRALIGFSVGKC
ncbi:hypothetical protein IFM89_019880 [Coptis chinensis]|uniref:Peptidase A1 domain-containing protein n=1 Tax=Coptis chinensis TaxID=261450 RepID=A0A835LIM0_9MAGN|nr:hypothetical protein IFM89_019880 [Coptis chinensis]